MKKTPWFPAAVKPIHEGVYETFSPTYGEPGWFSRWDGKKWGAAFNARCDERSIKLAAGYDQPATRQDRRWRGLAQKP